MSATARSTAVIRRLVIGYPFPPSERNISTVGGRDEAVLKGR